MSNIGDKARGLSLPAYWGVFVLLVAFLTACPKVEAPPEGGGGVDVGGHGDVVDDAEIVDVADDFDAADDVDESTTTLEIGIVPQAHSVLPAGWVVDDQIQIILAQEIAGEFVGQGQLSPGVFTLNLPGQNVVTMEDRTLLPLAGSHLRADVEHGFFLAIEAEEVRIEIDDDEVRIERVDSSSVGAYFDDAILSLGQETADAVEVMLALQTSLREAGGQPVDASELGYFFLAIGSDDGIAPDLRGTFNDWNGGESFEFRPIYGRLWGRFVPDIDGYHAYKITYGGGATWFTDFGNPHIDWDGVATIGLGSFNSIIHPLEQPDDRGRLYWLPRVYSPQLENTREVYVYLPRSYDADDGPQEHPLLIVHDGNESIARGQFHHVADERGGEEIIAFVALHDQNERMAEYTMATDGARGPDYAEFLVHTLLPELDSRFRISQSRTEIGLAGSSLGGLISFWVASEYPDVFAFAGGMSSSFFWADDHMLEVIAEKGCQDITYYLDSGSPQDNYQVTLAMRDQMIELGCDHIHLVDDGGLHQWNYWHNRFANVLEAFITP